MNILKYSVTLGAILLLPISAFAASLTLTPTAITSKVGQTFSISITADPSGAKAYTTRANVSFDPALLEFMSFSFAPKWIVLSQAGYDSEDNVKGVLIKTAGYPGGVTSATVLGTATFRAKTTGTSIVQVTTDSLVLDSSGKNVIVGTQGATQIVVSAPTQTQIETTSVAKPATGSTAASSVAIASIASTDSATATATATTTATPATTSALAAAGAAGFSFGSMQSILLLLLALALVAGGTWYYRSRMN